MAIGCPLRANHRITLTTAKKSSKREIVFDFPLARSLPRQKYLLHGFKQSGRNQGLKVSIKPFLTVLHKSQIGTVGDKAFDGSFGKWRSIPTDHAEFRQKCTERQESMRSFGVFLECKLHNPRFRGMWCNIPFQRIVHITKGSEIKPLATAQFLAYPTLDILSEVVGIVFGLSERHLQHKEPLRGWFKPKSRKAQRHDFLLIDGIYHTPAIHRITRQSIRMPREDANTITFFNSFHQLTENLASRCLCAFRLLKFLQDFKIFFTRMFSQFKKLRLNAHYLAVIVFGALARVKKIFWFGHICFWIRNKDKSARFSLPAPYRFVAERRHFLSASAPLARLSSVLSDSEVSICGEILRFARTFFEQSTK